MENTRNTVAVLTGRGENDAITGLMTSLAHLCELSDLKVEIFNVSDFNPKESQRFFNTISSGHVLFGLTYLGIGQSLEVATRKGGNQNAWEFFNIPLLKLQGDIPAYFLERHGDLPRTSVNLYGCEEFLAFHQSVLPKSTSVSMLIHPWLISDTPEAEIDFSLREKGTLHFIKNGGNPADLETLWRERLAPEVANQLLELSREVRATGLKVGKLDLHGLVHSYLASQRIDIRANAPLLCFFAAQMDDYLRRTKSTLLAQALLACPVVIQGNRWDHLDTAGAVATLLPAQTFQATEAIYQTQLGVIDMSPNLDTSCHDRMMRSAGSYSFALTNQSSWLEGLLPELNDAAFCFHPDQIQSAVQAALKDPAACVELGRTYGRAFRAAYPSDRFVARLTTVAELTRLRHASPKPPLQPYMMW
ncbi:MAG: hypothetical protein HGB30_03040 [Holophagaceae bacterium]|nr:hypothetical protein [Holophagaceae bacterium]